MVVINTYIHACMHTYVHAIPYQTRPDHTRHAIPDQTRRTYTLHISISLLNEYPLHQWIFTAVFNLPRAAEVGGIALVLIYGAAFVAALANPLTKRRQEVASPG